jgi:hypothetical protein
VISLVCANSSLEIVSNSDGSSGILLGRRPLPPLVLPPPLLRRERFFLTFGLLAVGA